MLALVAVVLLACLGACRPERAWHSDFRHIPQREGWGASLPVTLTPVYSDSSTRYDIELAIRHDTSYPFQQLNLVVDLEGDSIHTKRRKVVFPIADEAGNWLGAGFGTLYQCHCIIARDVTPNDVSQVVVWQTMSDTTNLRHVTDIGIVVKCH